MPDTSNSEGRGKNGDSSEDFKPHPSSGMHVNRRLKSFGSPDLEVVVGESQHLYRYHSFVLASYSGYIDTMLSSNMWKETREKHISFPDIEPEMWEKVIMLLEPGGIQVVALKYSELLDLLPFFDKYQFEDGMQLCNRLLENLFNKRIASSYPLHKDLEVHIPLAAMVYAMDLPSKPKTVEYASDLISKWLTNLNEDQFGQLLPIVENNDAVLREAVITVVGRSAKDMSIEDIRTTVKDKGFFKRCKIRSEEIKEVEAALKRLSISKDGLDVSVYINDEYLHRLSGNYLKHDKMENAASYYDDSPKHPGALRVVYRLSCEQREERGIDARIESMDVFGNVWHFYVLERKENEGDEDSTEEGYESSRNVVLMWEGGYSSLVPPKFGWKGVGEDKEVRCVMTFEFENDISYNRYGY